MKNLDSMGTTGSLTSVGNSKKSRFLKLCSHAYSPFVKEGFDKMIVSLRRYILQVSIAVAPLGLLALIFTGLILAQELSELTGRVELEGRTKHSGVRIIVGGDVLGTTGPDGTWRISLTISGPHQLEIAMRGFLSAEAIIEPGTAGGGAVVYDAGLVHLEAGDVNGDGQIDTIDLNHIGAAQDPHVSFHPVLDLNGDSRIDDTDYDLAKRNIHHKTSTFSLTAQSIEVQPTPSVGSARLTAMRKWLSRRGLALLGLLLAVFSAIIVGISVLRTRRALIAVRRKDPEGQMLTWVESVRSIQGALTEPGLRDDLNTGELLKELGKVRTKRGSLKRFKE